MYVLAQKSIQDETRLLVADRRITDHQERYAFMTENEFNALQTYRGHLGTLIKFRTKIGIKHFLRKHPVTDHEIVKI